MGLIFSFAAEDFFGAYSFRNKCSTNHRHRIHQGRYEMWWRLQGKKGNEDQYDDDKWKTLNEIRGALESEKCKETFVFTCILFKGKNKVDLKVEISNMRFAEKLAGHLFFG